MSNEKGEILLIVEKTGDWDKAIVKLSANQTAQSHYGYLMCAAEFLLHCAAKESPAGYENALEFLKRGARTYDSKNLKLQ